MEGRVKIGVGIVVICRDSYVLGWSTFERDVVGQVRRVWDGCVYVKFMAALFSRLYMGEVNRLEVKKKRSSL